jgi:hypothetical protein
MSNIEDDFEGWVKKWDDAQREGIFKDAPKPANPSGNTSDHSFFGLRQDNPTNSIDDVDAKYWNAISSMADGGVDSDIQRIDEDMGVAGLAAPSPNPVRRETEGKDQEIKPRSMGLTFDEEDIRNLEHMKIKLHELESKAAAMGEKNYDSEIKAMISKIDAISNSMCKPKVN